MFLNFIKFCTQKLRGRVSTIYFTNRKDVLEQGIRQVSDHKWHPVEKPGWLGTQTRESKVRNRLGYGGSGNSGRDQVQELLPEISSHESALVSLPLEQSGNFSHCAKIGSELSTQNPIMGKDLLRVLLAQLFTCKHAAVLKDSALQLDHFIYLLPAHCKCEITWQLQKSRGCVRNQLGRVSREKVICYDMVSWLFIIVDSFCKDFWLLEG